MSDPTRADPDEADPDVCPIASDGRHAPDDPEVAQGYDPKAEGGLVVILYCQHCGRPGNYKIPYDDVLW